jgi:hypothetical protein
MRLPEIYASLADPELFSDFGSRQPTFDPGVAEIVDEIGIAAAIS